MITKRKCIKYNLGASLEGMEDLDGIDLSGALLSGNQDQPGGPRTEVLLNMYLSLLQCVTTRRLSLYLHVLWIEAETCTCLDMNLSLL